MSRGRYIVIEGLDGCGKTTQFKNLVAYLGEQVVGVREPGGTPMAEHIRGLLLDKHIPRSAIANTFLFAAARVDLIDTAIRPAVEQGHIVVSDRNWLTSAAYQAAEGVLPDDIIALNKLATKEFFEPDFTILIDAQPATCYSRLMQRGQDARNYFEAKGPEFFERARQLYLQQVVAFRHKAIIDGEQDVQQVWSDVKAAIDAIR